MKNPRHCAVTVGVFIDILQEFGMTREEFLNVDKERWAAIWVFIEEKRKAEQAGLI